MISPSMTLAVAEGKQWYKQNTPLFSQIDGVQNDVTRKRHGFQKSQSKTSQSQTGFAARSRAWPNQQQNNNMGHDLWFRVVFIVHTCVQCLCHGSVHGSVYYPWLCSWVCLLCFLAVFMDNGYVPGQASLSGLEVKRYRGLN